MNRVFLLGRLTRDPEVRYTTGEKIPVANFSLAINRGFGSDSGVDYIDVEAWNAQALTIEKYLKKGSQVAVEGSIRVSSYNDNEGNSRRSFRVRATTVHFVGSNNSGNNTNSSNGLTPADFATNTEEKDPYDSFGDDIKIAEIGDDELPF